LSKLSCRVEYWTDRGSAVYCQGKGAPGLDGGAQGAAVKVKVLPDSTVERRERSGSSFNSQQVILFKTRRV